MLLEIKLDFVSGRLSNHVIVGAKRARCGCLGNDDDDDDGGGNDEEKREERERQVRVVLLLLLYYLLMFSGRSGFDVASRARQLFTVSRYRLFRLYVWRYIA